MSGWTELVMMTNCLPDSRQETKRTGTRNGARESPEDTQVTHHPKSFTSYLSATPSSRTSPALRI